MSAPFSVTEELIEKLSGTDISAVTELDLSGRKLKLIDRSVFQKLTSLRSLNLSNNELRSLPNNLGLQNLRRLDISDNCLQSLEFVEQMPHLADLQAEGNGFQLADKFMAIFLCPHLVNVDGKSADRLKTAVQQCRDKFLPLIEACWMENFAANYTDGIKAEDLDVVMQSLVSKVKSRKLCSPGVPASFRDFMIDKLSTDLIMAASTGAYKVVDKKSVAVLAADDEKTEDMGTDENCNATTVPTPSSKFNSCLTHDMYTHAVKQCQQSLDYETQNKLHTIEPKPPVDDYNPMHFIRCHFCDKNALKKGHTDDDPTDEVTNVWCCSMEPDPMNHSKSTGIVATCGGDIVCLIDCSTGQVMKRYKEPKQEFYSLAWTTLTLENDGNKRQTNILAVGGFNGHLRLLHPAQLVCYGHYGTGRPNKAVASYYYSCLTFHPHRSTLLFCGSSDTTVTLFDIGIPSGAEYQVNIIQLLVLTSARQSAILNLVVHAPTSHLVAGTENGCFAWDVTLKSIGDDRSNKRREPVMELSLPVSGRPFIDGLVMVDNTYMACKSVTDGFIYVINLTHVLQRKAAGKVFGFEWVKTEHQYMSLGSSNGLLACGDDKGSILLYNIQSLISSKRSTASSFLAPSRVLQWPICSIDEQDEKISQMVDVLDKPEPLIINMVAISSDHDYIVAVTDCNLVCVWKRVS